MRTLRGGRGRELALFPAFGRTGNRTQKSDGHPYSVKNSIKVTK
jgi:hypothetical protein